MKTRPTSDTQIRNGVFGVVGHQIPYSLSPEIFRRVFDALGWRAVYALYDLTPAQFKRFVAAAADAGIAGFNVTQPYKVSILGQLDRLDATAKAVGAVNTVHCGGRGLSGFNTDVDGVEAALAPFRRELRGSSTVLLGCGGAARAVTYALSRTFQVAEITFAVRSMNKGRTMVHDLQRMANLRLPLNVCPLSAAGVNAVLKRAKLLVNATPVGGGALIERSPLPRGVSLPESLVAFDLIYRPTPSRFLREARQCGCKIVGGWPMLVGQAEAAFRIWTGRGFPIKTRRELLAMEQTQ